MSFLGRLADAASFAANPLGAATRLAQHYLNRDSKKSQTADLSNPSLPIVGAGAVFPVVWGTVDLDRPVLSWYGGLAYSGGSYRITAQFLLCHGIVESMSLICWDRKPVWGSDRFVSNLGDGAGAQFYQNSPNVWANGSGVVGYGRLYGGGNRDQVSTVVSHLADKAVPAQRGLASVVFDDIQLGSELSLHSPSFRVQRSGQYLSWPWLPGYSSLPAGSLTWYIRQTDPWTYGGPWGFEGVSWVYSFRRFNVVNISAVELTLTFEVDGPVPTGEIIVYVGTRGEPTDQIFRGNYEAAGFLTVPLDRVVVGENLVWVLVRDWGGLHHTGGTLSAGGYQDHNPVHAIRECLTDTVWGMRIAGSRLNDASFQQAAIRCWNESLGMSHKWDGSEGLGEYVDGILTHIDGILRQSLVDGTLEIKLLRNDYVADNLLELNVTNTVAVSGFNCPEFDELPNTVSVRYYDVEKRSESTVTVDNPVRAQQQGGAIEVQLPFLGLSRRALAQRVALRELYALSNQDRSCEIEATNVARVLNEGDAFRLNWPDYSPTPIVMRAMEVSLGDGTTDRVVITAVRDVFDLPATALDGSV